MAISPVALNGTIQNIQDVSSYKQNVDNRPAMEQMNMTQTVAKEIEHNMHQVHSPFDSDRKNEKFDAKEEGKNKYFAQPKKKDKEKETEGKVIVNGGAGHGFDIKI